jgi:hypothetical protein
MKKTTPLTALARAITAGGVLLLSACGGGVDGMSMPSNAIASQSVGAAAPAAPPSGPVTASLAIAALDQGTGTNADVTLFEGATSMCSNTVAGANMCLGGFAGLTGTAQAATGGKCIYLNLGATEMPRGFDILFRTADGRVLQLTSSSSFQPLTVGATVAADFGDIGLYQADGKQWFSRGNSSAQSITVSAVSHNQIVLHFNRFGLPANTGFGAAGSIALTGSATIDCDPRLDSVR